MDYETLLERTIETHKQAGKSLWECAKYVHMLYSEHGMYERDFSAILCNELAIQRDTLYHWRKAWGLRQAVSETIPNVDKLGLSISHFYTAADYVERHGLEWVTDYLQVAGEARWSARRFAAELEIASDDSGTGEWLMRKIGQAAERLVKLYQNSETSGLADSKRRRLFRIILLLKGFFEE